MAPSAPTGGRGRWDRPRPAGARSRPEPLVGWFGCQLDDPQAAQAGGRLSALLFVLCGALVVAVSPLPVAPGGDRVLLAGVGLTACVVGGALWHLPWRRWPRSTSLWIVVPLALVLIDIHDVAAGGDGYRYPLFFLVLFVWIGLVHPRGASMLTSPALLVAYTVPLLLLGHGTSLGLVSLAYTGPVCLLLGEIVASVAERLRRSERAVRTSEERWRSLVMNASDMVVVIDANGVVQYATPAVTRLFGYSEQAAVGLNVLDLIHPSDLAFVIERLALTLDRRGPGELIEFRVARLDGSFAWVESVGTNLLDEPTVEGIVCNVRDISERKASEAARLHQAQHDSLTGLPNRLLLGEELTARVAHPELPFAVLLVDIDRFRDVNDGLGHHTGDRLLLQMAARLADACRPGDVVAHLGGDEFALVARGIASSDDAGRLAARLAPRLQEPVELDGMSLHVSTSIGAVWFGEAARLVEPAAGSGDTPGRLLRQADAARRRAKSQATGWAVWGPEDAHDTSAQLALVADLRHAIDTGALDVHFQPQIDLRSGRIVQVEALVRWNRAGTDVAPDCFVPLAEHTGLIRPLTAFVLNRALRQCRFWLDEGLTVAMSVNVSPSSLRDPELIAMVATALLKTGVPAHLLTLELTETALADQSEAGLAVLAGLRSLGLRLSIDDFGTGYSSMAYLKRLPVDELKIDRAFILDMATDQRDRQLTRTMIDLAHSLDLVVVAEGVEGEAVRAVLEQLGCDLAQGFGLCRPVSGADLTGWLAQRDAAATA